MITALDDRSDVDIDRVKLIRVQKRAQHVAAAFDQDIGHLRARELLEQRYDRDTTRAPERRPPRSRALGGSNIAGGPAELRDRHQHGAIDGLSAPDGDESGNRAALSSTTRVAKRGPGGRAVSSGSSATTVPMPTTMASILPRSSCTCSSR